jgi:hypothetical protein
MVLIENMERDKQLNRADSPEFSGTINLSHVTLKISQVDHKNNLQYLITHSNHLQHRKNTVNFKIWE